MCQGQALPLGPVQGGVGPGSKTTSLDADQAQCDHVRGKVKVRGWGVREGSALALCRLGALI